MKKNFITIIVFIFNQFTFTQNFSFKGRIWYSGLTSNDIPKNFSTIESKLGTITTFSLYSDLINNHLIDFEYAHKIDQTYSGDSIINADTINIKIFNKKLDYINQLGEPYRFWVRFSNEKIEARLGLQKITFGPAQILRNVSWFDNIDLTDPTNQIKGVKAFRLKWFPSNIISLWSWSIFNKPDSLSFGFRSELSHNSGEWGITYHANQLNNIGLDYRYDGYFGLWSENSLLLSENKKQIISTLGLDYTIPIGNGLYLMIEFMSVQQPKIIKSKENYAALLTNMPIGMIHQISIISQINIKENRYYNFFQWSSTYENISLNYIFSLNPKRKDYLPIEVPNVLENFGSTFQIMFIYNY